MPISIADRRRSPTSPRFAGYDIARALATFAMVIVNFNVVLVAPSSQATWASWIAHLLEGRAVAVFVVLAGAGVTLSVQKLVLDGQTRKAQQRIAARAGVLFVMGVLFAVVWPADILHFYGAYMLLAVVLIRAQTVVLWIFMGVLYIVFAAWLITYDYAEGWNFGTLDYVDFWRPSGFLRHLFFNGFHPVFPWASLFVLGLWLGRVRIQYAALRRRLLASALAVALIAESAAAFVRHSSWALSLSADERWIFATEPLPPSPFYIVASGATAVAVVLVCEEWSRHFGRRFSRIEAIFATLGQFSLSVYFAHVVFVLVPFAAIGDLHAHSGVFALGVALSFGTAVVLVVPWWKRRCGRGPMERLFRFFAGLPFPPAHPVKESS